MDYYVELSGFYASSTAPAIMAVGVFVITLRHDAGRPVATTIQEGIRVKRIFKD